MYNDISKCYQRSIELLLRNSTKDGFMAATPKGRATSPVIHYDWIFGRDASICALGAVASGDRRLIKIARATLITLAKHQSKYGQIPNALSEQEKKAEFYFMASVDGTLWWLIALNFYHRYSDDNILFKRLQPKIKRALTWLEFQTGGESNLLEQAGAGDWADIMPRSGHVLYANVLWYWVQKLYRRSGARLTKSGINTLFYPFYQQANSLFYRKNFLYRCLRQDIIKKIKPTDYYLSHIQVFSTGRHCDVYGNILSVLVGLPDQKLAKKILNYLLKQKVNRLYPVQVTVPPISRQDKEWDEVMEHRQMNLPYQYHNGGIWPFVGGFWVMMLAALGKKRLAQAELEKLSQTNKVNNWQFNEWFHGQTGKPMGIPGQSWNAGTFILAYHYLKGKIEL